MLVDDNQDNLAVLARRLQRRGYHVTLASTGMDALQLLRGQVFDVVVLDIMMPGMDGIEVLRRLRAERATAKLPVIMATAKTATDDLVHALEHGADDYVTKPIDFDVLLARMRAVLRRQAPHLAIAAPLTPAAPPVPPAPRTAEPASSISNRKKIEVGAVLDGRYRLDQLIGSGGFGAVFKGTHLALDNTVAVKVLHPEIAESAELRRRFQLEGVSSCRVRHPNAVTVFDAGTSDGTTPYLVMEYLEGFTLEALLRQQGLLSLARTAPIISQVCDVLAHAHSSDLIHRDIKPANIFLAQTVHGEVVKVLDFGLAKLLHNKESVELSGTRNLMGTPQFMAPERLTSEPSDHRVDVYSVGATLYLMLAGVMPHGLTEKNIIKQMRKQLTQPLRPLQELVPALPASLGKLIMAALARDPGARPSLGELQHELLRSADLPAGVPHPAPSPAAPPPPAAALAPLELGETLLNAPSSQALTASSDDGRPVGP